MSTNRKLLLLDSKLAEFIGDKEAIFLCQLNYWIENNKKKRKNYLAGKYWVLSSIDNWQENNFPFWSKDKVRRIINSLVNKDYVFTNKFYQNKNNQTKSYTINYLKLQKDFNFTFITETDNNSSNQINNTNKCDSNPFKQNDNSIYTKLPDGIMQDAQMECMILPKSLKENNKKINYIYNTFTNTSTNTKYIYNNELIKKGLEVVGDIDINEFNIFEKDDAEVVLNIFKKILLSKKTYLTINKERISMNEIQEKICSLNFDDIKYIVDVLNNKKGIIKNPENYVVSIFWNKETHQRIYYANRVRNDLGG